MDRDLTAVQACAPDGKRLNGKIFVGLVNEDNTMEWMEDKHIQVNQNNAEFMYLV